MFVDIPWKVSACQSYQTTQWKCIFCIQHFRIYKLCYFVAKEIFHKDVLTYENPYKMDCLVGIVTITTSDKTALLLLYPTSIQVLFRVQ